LDRLKTDTKTPIKFGRVVAGRLLVQEGIANELVCKLQEAVQLIRIGDPLTTEDPCMGPIVSESQYKKVLNYIQIGLQGTLHSAEKVEETIPQTTLLIQMALSWWLGGLAPQNWIKATI